MPGILILPLLLCSPVVPAHSLDGATATAHEAWIVQASQGLDRRSLETLALIKGSERRLLALRAYLRAGDSLAQHWSGTQAQLALYPGTPEGKAAMADLDVILRVFAAANPGYGLRVNREPRSLEVQIRRWNENPSVGAVADALAASLNGQYLASKKKPNTEDLRRELMDWKPAVEAPLAAPGLSAHGQGRAFDFQVEKDGRVIAGPDAALARTRWDTAGWTDKLKFAVDRAGHRFSGPLDSPYEPWHYTYIPALTLASP
jgi:hypothetical protein